MGNELLVVYPALATGHAGTPTCTHLTPIDLSAAVGASWGERWTWDSAEGPIAETLFGDRTTVAAWRSKPSRYLVTTEDLHHRAGTPAVRGEVDGGADRAAEGRAPVDVHQTGSRCGAHLR
ncbi:hypothetical protein [Streptomyces sp. NPDC005231]|uniref:hypothetical protein n=1 Tax=Streptomyces sp. NPDC005231 TaxID=3157026 RepID=UPI0033B3961D